MEQPEPLYTVEQVADRLQVQPATVRVWLRLGKLHGTQPGNSRRVGWRVRASELERFIDEEPGGGRLET
jgi:excisionase family DNA binding protein